MKRRSAKLAWFVMPTPDVEAAKLLFSDLIKAAPPDQRRRRHDCLFEAPYPLVPGQA